VFEQLLKTVKVNLAAADEHPCIAMTQAMQRAEVFGQLGLVALPAGRTAKILTLPSILAGDTKGLAYTAPFIASPFFCVR